MTTDHETTTDEIDRLRNDDGEFDARHIASGNPQPIAATIDGGIVTPEQCHEWQRRAATGETVTAIAAGVSSVCRRAVRYHVRGKCKHDHNHVSEDAP